MTDIPTPTRRRILAGASALAAVSMPAIGARAQTRRLSVAISAIYRKSFEAVVVPRMKEMHNVELAISTMLSAEALARAIGQRASPQISLFTLDQGPWQQGKDLGLWGRIDTASVPNLAGVPDVFRDPDGLGSALFNYMTGFCYDEAALKAANVAPPKTFFDMWSATFKNRIAMPQFTNTFAYITLEHATKLAGGDPAKSFDAGFQKMRELRPNIRTFIGPLGQLIQLFQQKEIWLAFAPQLSALQAAAAGLPVKWSAPTDGAVALSQFLAIPANAPAPDDARRLADLMLSPDYQKALAETDFMVPANAKTELGRSFAETFPVTPEISAKASQVSWTEYNKQRVPLSERWQREIQS
jgi:putative spermidine/putrescine transport system substrate-binding protein